MKYIKSALPFILGIPAGYILTLKVFSEIIPVLFGTMGIVYPLVLYSTLFFTILFFIVILQRMINGKISRLLFMCIEHTDIHSCRILFQGQKHTGHALHRCRYFIDTGGCSIYFQAGFLRYIRLPAVHCRYMHRQIRFSKDPTQIKKALVIEHSRR